MSGQFIAANRPYQVLARCPSCGESELIRMSVVSRLDRTPGSSQLGLKVKADKVDHVCGQTAIAVPGADELDGQEAMFDGADE